MVVEIITQNSLCAWAAMRLTLLKQAPWIRYLYRVCKTEVTGLFQKWRIIFRVRQYQSFFELSWYWLLNCSYFMGYYRCPSKNFDELAHCIETRAALTLNAIRLPVILAWGWNIAKNRSYFIHCRMNNHICLVFPVQSNVMNVPNRRMAATTDPCLTMTRLQSVLSVFLELAAG